jgi:hypothetical protein
MQLTSRFGSARVLFGAAALLSTACAPPQLFVEVLPPRSSITCAAPSLTDPASARGVLDLTALDSDRGMYLGDLRFSATAADAEVTGVRVEGAGDAVDINGRLALLGEGEDIRRGVLENVTLVNRAAAQDVRDATDRSRAIEDSIELTITPLVNESRTTATPVPVTFSVDLCEGCLLEAQDPCAITQAQPSCRPGQDLPSIICVAVEAPGT